MLRWPEPPLEPPSVAQPEAVVEVWLVEAGEALLLPQLPVLQHQPQSIFLQ